jgi:superfamily II DNA or RNA helicase
MPITVLAPGARVLIRDAEWLVQKVDRTSTGSQALAVVGLSEVVKNKEAVFLTDLEQKVEVLDPVDTKFVVDTSSYYRDSRLYMESLLRQTPPTDEKLYIGQSAAIDLVPYQLDPAIQALNQPRQRILIADAVGLGKTIEAGILLAELIKRGRAKRILVLTVKSMLTQFQKELWSRFTIPLTRLDSIGIQRIRSRIPTNHNPFYYYDKSIISIDTLKQDAEYRTYIENSYWDVIVIDEAHNVAERGIASMRARLAKLLSSRSDTLLMLSATPHDGKPKAFASLMNMLNPTAIANPEEYGPEDIKGLFIRRFKKDIKHQVTTSFKERKISVARVSANKVEEEAFNYFVDMQFTKIDKKRSADKLFKTTLEKALFSSPAACQQTIHNRIRTLKSDGQDLQNDIAILEQLAVKLEGVSPVTFSKYQKLLQVIRDKQHGFGWTGADTRDRLVIFTERIETLIFLEKNLKHDLGLEENKIEILHGTMDDIKQQRIVENFGNEQSPIRLLIASDVASEGINLHFLSHKMIHFDIPWSLMVFQQRNGRIDRYGQEREPLIVYLVTDSANDKIKGDTRILELLVQKDEQAVKNIGDPSALMGVFDIDQEEAITAKAIEDGATIEDFETLLAKSTIDPLAILLGKTPVPTGQTAEQSKSKMPSLFADDFHYFKESVEYLRREQSLQADFDDRIVTITPTKDIEYRFKFLPKEVFPESGQFILTDDREKIKKEIENCRKRKLKNTDEETFEEQPWPQVQLLWEQHPILQWANDKVVAAFGRHEAPILVLKSALEPKEVIYIVSGLIPNRKSHPLIHRWFGVQFKNGTYEKTMEFGEILSRTRLHDHTYPNQSNAADCEALKNILPEVIARSKIWMEQCWKSYETDINVKLNAQLTELERLRNKKYQQLEIAFQDEVQPSVARMNKKERERREIDRMFDQYLKWIEDTMTTENNPYIRVVAALKGGE